MLSNWCQKFGGRCRWVYVVAACSLRLVLVTSLLTVGISDLRCAGASQSHDDVATSTILADVVVEGRVDRLVSQPRRLMIVRVLSVFKGRQLRRTQRNSTALRIAVDRTDVLTDHITASTSTPTRAQRLIMFLRQRNSDAVLTYYVTFGGIRRRRKVNLYRMSASPAAPTESALKTAKHYSKQRHLRRPRVKITGMVNDHVIVEDGVQLQVRCRVSGSPHPDVTWLKDGLTLHGDSDSESPHIRYTRRGTVLRVRRVDSARDTGLYQCVASNDIGTAQSQVINVTVIPRRMANGPTTTTEKPHSVPCDHEGHCFNGGTCFHFESLQRDYCVCVEGFQGERCEERVVSPIFHYEDDTHR